MREKIALIGAGSASFTRGLLADLIQRRWEAELALVDTDPAALQVAEGLARKMIADGGGLRVLQQRPVPAAVRASMNVTSKGTPPAGIWS